MIRNLFERKASYEANVLAEAQALIDDGLELDFVLGLFPNDEEWLAPLLHVTDQIEEAFESEPASYYFEASLKSKFMAGAEQPKPVVPVVLPAPSFSPMRTAIATMSVGSVAAAVGVMALGFITAGDSVPGDWNYTFKLANERFEYSLSRGDHRIDVQIQQAQNRVLELNKLNERGSVSPSQLARVQKEFDELREISRGQDLDPVQKAQIESAGKSAVAVLNDVRSKQPELPAEAVAAAIDDTVTVLVLPTPPATPTAAATGTPAASATPGTPTASATPSPSVSATPSPSATASQTPGTETPTPTETGTVEPQVTATQEPLETETAAPEATP